MASALAFRRTDSEPSVGKPQFLSITDWAAGNSRGDLLGKAYACLPAIVIVLDHFVLQLLKCVDSIRFVMLG